LNKRKHAYSSRKNPASLKHFTLAFFGKWLVKLSQCRKVAKPPAEQPESKAYRERGEGLIIYLLINKTKSILI
jgi:hypothetical protein